MEKRTEYQHFKSIFWRYMDVMRGAGVPVECAILTGFSALLVKRKLQLPVSFVEREESAGIMREKVFKFLDELGAGLEGRVDVRRMYVEHPSLRELLAGSENLSIDEDVEILSLLDESLFKVSALASCMTPLGVAELMVKLVGVKPNESVLDPCCGTGAFLLAVQQQLRSSFHFTGVERNGLCLLFLRLKKFLSGQRSSDEFIGSAFNFIDSVCKHDVVLANPPVEKLTKELRDQYSHRLGYEVSSNHSLNFVDLGLKLLKSAGRAAFLVPVSVLFSGGSEESFRQFWVEQAGLKSVICLPSGVLNYTGARCAILVFEEGYRESSISLVSADDCGETVRGRGRSLTRNDIREIISRTNATKTDKARRIEKSNLAENGYVLVVERYVTPEVLSKRSSGNWVPLGDIAEIHRGTPLSKLKSGSTLIVQGKDLRTKELDRTRLDGKDFEGFYKPLKITQVGDILLQRIGDNPAAYMVQSDDVGLVIADTVFVLRFRKARHSQIRYICEFLNSGKTNTWLKNARTSAVIPSQSLRLIRALEVPLPDDRLLNASNKLSVLEKKLEAEYIKAKESRLALFDGTSQSDLSASIGNAQFLTDTLDQALNYKDDVNYIVRTQYPFPVAYAFRHIYVEREYAGIYERQMKFGEQLLSFFAAIALALVSHKAVNIETTNNKAIEDYRKNLERGLSPGHIRDALRDSCKLLSDVKDDNLASEFSQIWCKKGSKKQSAFAKLATDELVQKLNDFKHHRGPTNKYERKVSSEAQKLVLEEVLQYLQFCSGWQLIRIDEIDKRWASEKLEYSASLLKGDHPAFEQMMFASSKKLSKDMLYLNFDGEYICLYPLLVVHYNESTRREEIFTPDKINQNKLVLKSFESGSSVESQDVYSDFDRWSSKFYRE